MKIDVIDEQDGLEGKKVQTGSGLDDDGKYEEYEGYTDEEAVDEDNDGEYENSKGGTDDSLPNHLKMRWFQIYSSNTSITSLWGDFSTYIIMAPSLIEDKFHFS